MESNNLTINPHPNTNPNDYEEMKVVTQEQDYHAQIEQEAKAAENGMHDPSSDGASATSYVKPPAVERLPDELVLQILKDVLVFPNGLQSDRFAAIAKARADKFALIGSPVFTRVMDEVLYGSKKVVIKARSVVKKVAGSQSQDTIAIAYPTLEQSTRVRELEFQPWLLKLQEKNRGTIKNPKIMSYEINGKEWGAHMYNITPQLN
jgi:hypothetical protein